MTQPLNWHFAAIWESIADFKPSSEALVDGDQRLTWREFDDRAARLASCYQQRGLKPGSKVAIYSFNCAEYLIAQYATFKMSFRI
jgi:fatty-acyl-CoA synthase